MFLKFSLMKKLLLFLTIFASTFSPVKSQTSVYHPFPDSNAVWNVNIYIWAGCFPVSDLYEDYSYVFAGDTILNSLIYHKLNTPFVQSNCGNGFQSPGYKGCIRQDTAFKKVYIIMPGDSVGKVLYDFNLHAGDTVEGFFADPPMCNGSDINNRIVYNVDSILIGSDYRKRWTIGNAGNPTYFIEGIGSEKGLLETICQMIDGPGYSLTCFSQNNQALYPDTITLCDVILTVQQNQPNNFSISISPNPFHASAQLIIKGNSKIKNAELKIYNALGECISSKIMNGESAIIERENLPDGIYFYRLLNDKIAGSGKFVIE
jgi:hypothetical protein